MFNGIKVENGIGYEIPLDFFEIMDLGEEFFEMISDRSLMVNIKPQMIQIDKI